MDGTGIAVRRGGVETFLRRQLWALDLLVLGTVAVLAARATAHAADARLLRLCDDEGAPPAELVAPLLVAPAPEQRGDEIVRRNVFCSACRVPARPPVTGDDSAPLSLRLLAIMFATPPADPRLSVAVIKDQRGAAGAYTVGSPIGPAVVDAIDELHVFLRLQNGGRQALTLLGGERPVPSRSAPAPPDPLFAELDAGIIKVGENRYGVRRDTIESLLGKMDRLAPQARVEADVRDGKPIGFRLRDVKRDGVFAKIGLRDGDVISSVNGLATTGPDNALAIYASLRSLDHLSVGVERAGRRLTTEYDIE